MRRFAILTTTLFMVATPPFTMTVGEQITATQSAVSATAVSSSAIKHTEKPKKRRVKKAKAKTEVFKVTAYCPCHECSGEYGRQTATGHMAKSNHTIAVDPTVIQYGTHVKINGVEYIAEDCGGAVKGNTIDIFFDTHEETEQFGVQYLEVEVIR